MNHHEQREIYNEAWGMAVMMYESGMKWDVSKPVLVKIFGSKINLDQLQKG